MLNAGIGAEEISHYGEKPRCFVSTADYDPFHSASDGIGIRIDTYIMESQKAQPYGAM